jgi:hypothetical protein
MTLITSKMIKLEPNKALHRTPLHSAGELDVGRNTLERPVSLGKIRIRDAEYLKDDASSEMVFHVNDPHALIQAAGYLKYVIAKSQGEGIYFRGETKVHSSLSPTLFRVIKTNRTTTKYQALLNALIKHIRSQENIFAQFSSLAHEPLLQHYGVRTSWIDLVDNVWVALWFACHKAHGSGKFGEFLHFERRSAYGADDAFAYILLIGADLRSSRSTEHGVVLGNTTELVDLRIAAPSIFLRPHAQHGLLFRCRGDHTARPTDYSSQIRGIIRISLQNALAWLGDGRMLGVHALFPPPFYDHGYSILLAAGVQGSKPLGVIAHVGA